MATEPGRYKFRGKPIEALTREEAIEALGVALAQLELMQPADPLRGIVGAIHQLVDRKTA